MPAQNGTNDPLYYAEPRLRSDPAEAVYNVLDPIAGNNFPTLTRAIRATGAGYLDVVTAAGGNARLNFMAGETRPIRISAIVGGTATGVELMF